MAENCTPENQLISARVAARALGMSTGSLYRLTRQGTVPAFRIGVRLRGVRFDLREVREALRRPVAVASGEVQRGAI